MNFSLIDPVFIARNWGEFLATANLYSLALIAVFWIKARTIPDSREETIITGKFWYDLFNGGELHPRTGNLFDWKHFNASRTGVSDLSFAALQYQNYGGVTDSMILAVLFRMTVTIEYFWYENWFFETLDGSFERFSFYNIFGFSAMMPHLWTLQTQYLATHPTDLSRMESAVYITLFVAGWYMRHIVDDQKSRTRASNGDCIIWGKKAKVLIAKYTTADGKTHQALLLCSGFWGIARHVNYAGSFLYTLASCLICGRRDFFPYTEAVIVAGMTIHRCFRDEARCRAKYGDVWDEYCKIVRWRIVPGVF
ncbi:related to c-14 sterol reductase ERG-3 [Ramularia collo-cygni]|uniref:7-dehydrocholesterol reductase n=1 Tax=Ramularia collo-cygni TaxID=112498 RepID=A0A2D3UYZ6_9PEZI|nr:related to c-14 sterol reductase ERG-3 [Ramularia collo-cygni]CZT18430.1 related to c-14 sterol reductase ERG-3 [Ramularia collo-cygni]